MSDAGKILPVSMPEISYLVFTGVQCPVKRTYIRKAHCVYLYA
jgi:hypothetical protein